MRSRLWLFLAVLLVVTSCTGTGNSTTITTAVSSTTSSSTTTATEATTTTDASTTTVAPTTTAQEIDISFEGGEVVGPERFSFSVGDEVSIWLLTDTDEEVHVHGYDLFFEATAGTPLEIVLTADVPGIFEVELESTHTLLFELEVAP